MQFYQSSSDFGSSSPKNSSFAKIIDSLVSHVQYTTEKSFDFKKLLEYHRLPEWEELYIHYDFLINRLYQLYPSYDTKKPLEVQVQPLLTNSAEEPVQDEESVKSGMFALINCELNRVESSYLTVMIALEQNFCDLEGRAYRALDRATPISGQVTHRTIKLTNRMEVSKEMFVELYRHALALRNFGKLNHLGFDCLLREYDKASNSNSHDEFISRAEKCEFYNNKRLTQLAMNIEKTYAKCYEGDDRDIARIAMYSKTGVPFLKWALFRLGFKLGFIIPLILLLIFIYYHSLDFTIAYISTVVPVYRLASGLILAMWLWGIAQWVFMKYRINDVFILNLDPRTHLTFFQVFDLAASMTIVFLVNLIFCMLHHDLRLQGKTRFPSHIWPFSLLCYLILSCFLPFDTLSPWSSRKFLIKSIFEVLIAPFGRVDFVDNLIGDLLTSFIKPLTDLGYSICFYVGGLWLFQPPERTTEVSMGCEHSLVWISPLCSALPFVFRFLQCMKRYYETGEKFPHLANAGKYFFCNTIIVYTTAHPGYSKGDIQWDAYHLVWVSMYIFASLYASSWDVLMDWGLGRCKDNFLRKDLRIKVTLYYYWCILSNFVLRFFWTLTILPAQANPLFFSLFDPKAYHVIYLPAISLCEIFRRMQWTILRVEFEHTQSLHRFKQFSSVPFFFYIDSDKIKKLSEPRSRLMLEIIVMFIFLAAAAIVVAMLGTN